MCRQRNDEMEIRMSDSFLLILIEVLISTKEASKTDEKTVGYFF